MKQPIEKIKSPTPRMIYPDEFPSLANERMNELENKINELIERVNELYDNRK